MLLNSKGCREGLGTDPMGPPVISALQAAQPQGKLGPSVRLLPSLGQGTVFPSPPGALGTVFGCRRQLGGSLSRVRGCKGLPSGS